MRKGILISLTLLVAITVSTTVASAYETVKPFEPSWASWAEHLPPQIQQYITRDSEVVDWIYSPENGPTWPVSNWVKAAAYIIYYAPMEHVTPTPQRVIQAAEGPNLILPHKPNGIPDWGNIKWGTISESRFAQEVEHDPLNHGGVQVTDVFKAAVRIAYWVASFIQGWNFGTPVTVRGETYCVGTYGHDTNFTVTFKQFTPLEVMENPYKYWPQINGVGWNCAAHAVLAVALMRAAMIPAMIVFGKAYKNGTFLGYHCWVAFYNRSKKWVHVDPTGSAGGSYAETDFCRVLTIPNPRNPVEYKEFVDVEYAMHKFKGYYLSKVQEPISNIKTSWIEYVKYRERFPVLPFIPIVARRTKRNQRLQ